MRYGGKILFEDVSTTFLPGRLYGLTGTKGAGK
jgi:ATPase subunit of ABC transporter with duplicated ATPase domains